MDIKHFDEIAWQTLDVWASDMGDHRVKAFARAILEAAAQHLDERGIEHHRSPAERSAILCSATWVRDLKGE